MFVMKKQIWTGHVNARRVCVVVLISVWSIEQSPLKYSGDIN